jgi:hypothetical protein
MQMPQNKNNASLSFDAKRFTENRFVLAPIFFSSLPDLTQCGPVVNLNPADGHNQGITLTGSPSSPAPVCPQSRGGGVEGSVPEF